MRTIVTILIILQVTAWAQQAGPAYLEISGDVAHPQVFSEQEWKAMKHVTVIATNTHDKKVSTFSGVPLLDILQSAGARQVIVADSEEGKPLSPTTGPLRLIVPDDKRPARWVRMVKMVRVIANP